MAGRSIRPCHTLPSEPFPTRIVESVVVYLRSIPPIRNPLPRTLLSSEELKRYASKPAPLGHPVPEPEFSSPVEHGRHLAQLANCGGCHTSWHSSRQPGEFAGGNLVEHLGHKAFSSNLTPHASGMNYDATAFASLMRTGKAGLTHGTMPWIAYRNLSDADLAAIHAFLATRHPVSHFVSNLGAPSQCKVCGQEHGLGDRNHLEKLTGIALAAVLRGAYVGTYHSDEYHWTVQITASDGKLFYQDPERARTELFAQSDGRFLMDGAVAPFRFLRSTDSKATALVSDESYPLILKRIEPAEKTAPGN